MSRPASLARAGMSGKRAAAIWLVLAAVCAAVIFVAALTLGSVHVTPWRALAALVHARGERIDVSSEIVRRCVCRAHSRASLVADCSH